ncbi:MAG: DNA repair protein RecN [Marinicaulis sp.]|nr:DNA repair protein RecN [Marinicaulis sp.]
MLSALHIQDFVLIDRADLALGTGLTALTGETGAGKSILLDALGLAVGGRAERGAVRSGATQGIVAATFDVGPKHPVWGILSEIGLESGDEQIILRRVQGKDGRTRAFVNDQPVSVSMLRTVGETLLEIHGQHDGRGFLSATGHRAMLDEFGGLSKLASKVAQEFSKWREFERELETRRRERDSSLREADYLRHVVSTLVDINPQPDEEKRLAEERAAMMAAEKISDDLDSAAAALDEGGVDKNLSVALRNIERASARLTEGFPALTEASSRLDAALNETAEARAVIERAVSEFGIDTNELEKQEERLFLLRGEARKHGVTPDGLSEFLSKAKTALEDLEMGEAAFGDLESAIIKARKEFEKSAASLSVKRKTAAAKLDKSVAAELAPLKLGKASFKTQIITSPNEPTSAGIDAVEFMVATNPGAPAGPLKTIASGGELSRFVLAMKAALAAEENRTVIIFDEVDAGVGGAVADAVGERLARLAQDAQVLVVTHSPQVAARAKAQWRIEKTQAKTKTTTKVAPMDDADRVEEIARMLSGAEVTNEARAAAQKLLGLKPNKPIRKKLAKTG